MSLSTAELLAKARTASKVAPNRTLTEKWMPVVEHFRNKNWSYIQIYDWLKAQGEPVQKCRSSFVSAVSRRYRRKIEKARIESISKKTVI